MKLSISFGVILLGTAAIASAQPTRQEKGGRVSYTEHGARANPDAPRGDGEWIELASPTPAKHGAEFIIVGKAAGDFSQLRVDAHGAKVVVRRVRIYFDDGKQQIVDLDRVLDPHARKSAMINLKATKAIDRVVITTETQGTGKYALYGSSGAAGVATR